MDDEILPSIIMQQNNREPYDHKNASNIYRIAAKNALERAVKELEKKDNDRLRYAVLDLRMSLESLIYERACNYTEELSGKKLSTWQPKKLLEILLEIDPYADKSSSISIGEEVINGQAPDNMRYLGGERVIGLNEIKDYYDRLGSYLHAPTLEQLARTKYNALENIRIKCLEVAEIITLVLSSTITRSDFRVSSSLMCEECGVNIVRRMPHDSKKVIAFCINCNASYELTPIDNKKVEWKPLQQNVNCANPSCNQPFPIWKREFEVGTNWICPNCKGHNRFTLGVTCDMVT